MTKAASIQFSHMGIHVRDVERMRDFYTRLLGFVVTDEGETPKRRFAFLSRSADDHHQLVLAGGRPDDVSFNVLNQISFKLDSLATLRAVAGKLEGEGVVEAEPVNHGNAWALYFADPEGNRVECFVDTPWHCRQPCGENFDLDTDDETLLQHTENLCREQGGFMLREQWRERMAARLEE